MIYWGTGFHAAAVVWFGSSSTPLPSPSPVPKSTGDTHRKRDELLTGEGRKRGGRARSRMKYDRKKSWSSINLSILPEYSSSHHPNLLQKDSGPSDMWTPTYLILYTRGVAKDGWLNLGDVWRSAQAWYGSTPWVRIQTSLKNHKWAT
jgi:hypothetical protein